MRRRILMREYASSPRKEKSAYEWQEQRDYKRLQRAGVAHPVLPTHYLHRLPKGMSV